jgi:mannosyl-3-phosphoglycerate phosphatase
LHGRERRRYRDLVMANFDLPGPPAFLVLTDLDGTLLDGLTYSYEPAQPALRELRQRRIPLVLVSSKTRAELEPIRYQLDNRNPFVAENGGALFVPKGTFNFPLDGAILRGAYQVVEFGAPYAKLRLALTEIARTTGYELKGFGDMSVDEIVNRTGLLHAEAVLAKQREYDEPFVIIGPTRGDQRDDTQIEGLRAVQLEAEARGLRCISGGRFHHLLGVHDKGQACRYLIQCYRRQYGETHRFLTIALGDAENDLPMLAEADRRVLVKSAEERYAVRTGLPHVIRTDAVGPIGWNKTILELLGPP